MRASREAEAEIERDWRLVVSNGFVALKGRVWVRVREKEITGGEDGERMEREKMCNDAMSSVSSKEFVVFCVEMLRVLFMWLWALPEVF